MGTVSSSKCHLLFVVTQHLSLHRPEAQRESRFGCEGGFPGGHRVRTTPVRVARGRLREKAHVYALS